VRKRWRVFASSRGCTFIALIHCLPSTARCTQCVQHVLDHAVSSTKLSLSAPAALLYYSRRARHHAATHNNSRVPLRGAAEQRKERAAVLSPEAIQIV
jgi:hypothetical protein